MLADRKFIEMPPPMVPAPITPTLRTGRGSVFSGSPSILAALRAAKKKYRCAADCSPVINSMNNLRSSKIGRASCRERVEIAVVGAGVEKKKKDGAEAVCSHAEDSRQ